MLRFAKRICWLAVLGGGVQCASAFSLLGPLVGSSTGVPDGFEQPEIGYQFPGDIGTPKNFAEEYRRNTPVIYYTFEDSFLEYFGVDGSNSVVQAFEIMNALTNVSSFSAELSEYPYNTQSPNYLATALQLADLKSVTLNLIMEQVGLAEPDRYTWTLHDRLVGPSPGCPTVMTYLVAKRNFDPVFTTTDLLKPTSYVNGTLYSYFIREACTGTPFLSEAMEFPVDLTANTFTAVASEGAFIPGLFYTGLTRDDVGGLRYLLRTNNMNIEGAGTNTFTFITNNAPQLLYTSNLTLFADQALTNDAAALQALYPDLVILGSTPIFTNVVTATQIFYFTNYPLEPFGTPAHLVSATVLTTNVATYFRHTFANVRAITNNRGLVAAYDFQEGGGLMVNDVSGNGNHGAIIGATWAQGRFGNGLTFNGVNALVTINDSGSFHFTSGITLEAWVNPTSLGGGRDILYKDPNLYFLMGSTPTGNQPGFGGSFASTNVYGPAPLPLNTWTHLASTYDGATMRFYVNGVQVSSRAQTGPLSVSSAPLSIGGDASNGQYWAGLIDEVRIYNRALSVAEIQTDINTSVTGSRNGMPVTTLADVQSFTNSPVFILTTNISTAACPPSAPFGSICTNTSFTPTFSSVVRGTYFIIPSNLCDVSIVSTQLIQTIFVTNLLTVATNVAGATNAAGEVFSQSLVYSFDQHVFVVRPVVCPTNRVERFQGIEKMTFVQRPFDSLLNRTFLPVTNEYTLIAWTGNTFVPRRVQRVVTVPDILISAEDLADVPGNGTLGSPFAARNIEFDGSNADPDLAGPGTIIPSTVFTYNKVGPLYINPGIFFFGFTLPYNEATHTPNFPFFIWASFDGSTNLPVVYPNDASITNLENSVLIQVSPSAPVTNGAVQLPNGTVGVDYATVFSGFTVVGGQPPHSWRLADGSPALPPNLALNANGTISGAPAPSTAGLTFDFVIRVTAADSRFVDRPYAITINP